MMIWNQEEKKMMALFHADKAIIKDYETPPRVQAIEFAKCLVWLGFDDQDDDLLLVIYDVMGLEDHLLMSYFDFHRNYLMNERGC